MLVIKVPEREYFDEDKMEFLYLKPVTLKLEHSLLSISKWEAKHHKRFLDKTKKSYSETVDYIKCMTINHDIPDEVYNTLPDSVILEVNDYIDNPMTATTFSNTQKRPGHTNEAVSSELVYYWMTVHNIPFECDKWHFNRLMTLINICNIKNQPPKKMSKGAIGRQHMSLNAARRKAMHSSG